MKNDRKDFAFRVVIRLHDFLRSRMQSSEEENPLPVCGSPKSQDLSRIVRGKKVDKLFTSLTQERIDALISKVMKLDPTYHPPNFSNYYSVGCDGEIEAKEIAERFAEQDMVELAYIETHSASLPSVDTQGNPMSCYQLYLDPAPAGIDARYAWKFAGGDGQGNVKFIDIEQGWILSHEDIKVNQLPDTGWSHWQHEDHGTGVLGIIIMQDNAVGGIGITPETKGYVMSQWRPDGTFNTADAIIAAIDHLDFGDIILLEAQAFDILHSGNVWPVEAMDAVFQAIRLATALGMVVIEPTGNGLRRTGNDLDLFVDCKRGNIFNRSFDSFHDSGAIVVAAASSDIPHTRINYSNYGSRIDCFACGENVVTAGFSPRSSGLDTNKYSDKFSGTSSAAAIIAGAAIAVQSIMEAKCGSRLGPAQMRDMLSNELYGTASFDSKIDRIGAMPDLKKIIDQALNFIPLPNREFQKTNKSIQGTATYTL